MQKLAGVGGLDDLAGLFQGVGEAVHLGQDGLAGDGLDAAHAGGDGALGHDGEQAHLGGVVQMGAAAEFDGGVAHLDHADGVAVLLAEQGGGAHLLGLLDGQDQGLHVQALEHHVGDGLVDLLHLLRGDGGEVGEVKAQPVRLHQRAGLMAVVAQHGDQGALQQMGGGVGAADGLAALGVDGGLHGVAHLDLAVGHLAGVQGAVVQVLAALVLDHVIDLEDGLALADHAVVGDLAAHLGVEGGLVQHQDALIAAGDGAGDLLAHAHGQDLRGIGVVLVAGELGGGVVQTQVDARPGQVAQGLPGLAGALLLLLHELVEAVLVHAHALVLGHLDGQVDGEAVGVVQAEGVRAGEDGLAGGLVGREHFIINLHAAVNGAGEVLLLLLDHAGDVGAALAQVAVVALVLLYDGLHDLVQEGLVHAQQLAVAGGPAEQAAQHVAAAFIRGQHAVGDHEHGGAAVVGDDAQGHVALVADAVGRAGELGDLVRDVHHGIDLEQAAHVLAHHGQTLQAHAGVDVLLGQLGVIAEAVVVELAEHVVPDLDVAVAVAAHGAVGLAAAVLLAAVIVDLGAGAAGAGAVLPEVVLLAEAEDALRGDAHVLVPDVEGLVVVQIDGRIQPGGIEVADLGEELPAPGDGLLLEVVAEGEVAQHLKIGAVTGRLADVLDVAGADALLAGAHAVARRLDLALEVGLHRGHAGVDQQQRLVVLRDQGKAGQAQVALALEEGQEHLAQLIQTVLFRFHRNRLQYNI